MKTKMIIAFLLFTSAFTACKKDDNEAQQPVPIIENLELGLSNAGFGVIGRDFHFEADILAGDKIDRIEVKILQKDGESYSKPWKHEINWEQYRGAKNTNVHKHFNIPEDAVEGKYDFYVIVYDQNGTKLEVKRDFHIYSAETLPVDPKLAILNIHKNGVFIYDYQKEDKSPTEKFKKEDVFKCQATLSGIKGDGKMYLLLINKKANHYPETIEQIDFSKAIVYDVFEHKDEKSVYDFSNVVFDMSEFKFIRALPSLVIGVATDNNVPAGSAIAGAKAWETGEYSLVLLYKNTTYNMSYFKSVPFSIDYN